MEIKRVLQKTRTVSLMIIRAVRIKWFESYVVYTDVSGKINSSFFFWLSRVFFSDKLCYLYWKFVFIFFLVQMTLYKIEQQKQQKGSYY